MYIVTSNKLLGAKEFVSRKEAFHFAMEECMTYEHCRCVISHDEQDIVFASSEYFEHIVTVAIGGNRFHSGHKFRVIINNDVCKTKELRGKLKFGIVYDQGKNNGLRT